MAALCRTRAVAAESHFLRAFLFSRPCRGSGTESGSGSESAGSTESGTRPGGFASALERHSELQRKAELGRIRVSRGSFASDAVGGAGSRSPALGAWPLGWEAGFGGGAAEPFAGTGVRGRGGARYRAGPGGWGGAWHGVERAAGCVLPSYWPLRTELSRGCCFSYICCAYVRRLHAGPARCPQSVAHVFRRRELPETVSRSRASLGLGGELDFPGEAGLSAVLVLD